MGSTTATGVMAPTGALEADTPPWQEAQREAPADLRHRALLLRLLGRQMERILRLVDLEAQGSPVRPSGFVLGSPSGEPGSSSAPTPAVPCARGPRVRYEALQSYARDEPRLEVISKGLARALSFGHFADGSGMLAADGFRLRDLRQWSGYYAHSLADNIGAISSYCDCDCEFCFEKGTRHSGVTLGRGQLTLQEVATRARHYDPVKHTGLLQASRFSLEPFANPRCAEILERVAALAPGEAIDLTTNGSALTEEMVARMARLRPIFISVSLNAASVDVRRGTMHDGRRNGAAVALASPALLRQYEIPFAGSYVPWPSKPLSDLEGAVRLLDRHDAIVARVCMPSWTRFSAAEAPFDTERYWGEILEVVQRLRQEVSIPIHLMPNMYQLKTIRPVVQGTVKYSPAAEAGVRYGDVIVAVDGAPVYTRPEVAALLARRFGDASIRQTQFTLERDGGTIEVAVQHPHNGTALRFPYSRLIEPTHAARTWGGFLGLHLADSIRLSSFMRLKEIVEENAGKRILFFVSELGGPILYEGMAMLGDVAGFVDAAELYVETLQPRYWGGNVMIGDLWTVQDLLEQTREWMDRNRLRPDVVVVPSSFLTRGGRDLVGRCYLDVERILDVEVRLLRVERISL